MRSNFSPHWSLSLRNWHRLGPEALPLQKLLLHNGYDAVNVLTVLVAVTEELASAWP
jgi:uncharacterized protein YprB with RNaseH-like and TPR domain